MDSNLIKILLNSGIAVLKTDTLYGLVCLANNRKAVNRIYALKNRKANKPPIVLISSLKQMYDTPPFEALKELKQLWPGPNSVILPSPNAPQYITRGTGTVAYRLVSPKINLHTLIEQTGPLIAPSANPEGAEPAKDIQQAINYFGEKVDVYIDDGKTIKNSPSKLFLWTPEGLKRLR